jgi:hypothetical protein
VYLKPLRGIVAAVLLTSAIASPVSAAPAESAVLEWNRHAANALMNPATAAVPGAGQGPTVAVLHLAMVQGAVYDAVNGIDGGHEPYLPGLRSVRSNASQPAAVATAAHHVLVGLTPPLPQATLDWLDAEYEASMAEISARGSKKKVAAGVAFGADVAAAMLAARANDGRYVPFTFSQGTAPGEWRPTSTPPVSDPFAWVAKVDPFLLNSTSQFRSDGPLSMTSARYAREYNEVKALGSMTGSTRTDAQTALAMFYTANPVELLNRTFRGIADARNLTAADEARLFAMMNMAGSDGLISCWDDKEHWSFWRPLTAIRLGDTDGNPATAADPVWTPLVPNPPYPDHPSGYNCLTGAVIHTAVDFFGTNRLAFTVQQTAAAGSPARAYSRFTDVVRDTIDARMYLGIHFRTPDVQGAAMGRKVANWLDRHYFEPVD